MAKEERFYLTKEGLEKLKRQYRELKNLKLSKTKGEVPKIWYSEDLNPEYLSFQEDLSLLDAQILELENIFKNTELIKTPSKEKQNFINLGARVTVEIDGQTDEFEVVGTLEANPTLGRISNESPVGRVLMGRKVGEEVMVSSPIKTIYKIKKIKYSSS